MKHYQSVELLSNLNVKPPMRKHKVPTRKCNAPLLTIFWRRFCPGVQAFTVRGCLVVTPVDMLAVEVANIQTGVWERRDGRFGESRAWRFVDVKDLASCDVYAQPLSL